MVLKHYLKSPKTKYNKMEKDTLKQNLNVVVNTLNVVLEMNYIQDTERIRISECIDLLKKWY